MLCRWKHLKRVFACCVPSHNYYRFPVHYAHNSPTVQSCEALTKDFATHIQPSKVRIIFYEEFWTFLLTPILPWKCKFFLTINDSVNIHENWVRIAVASSSSDVAFWYRFLLLSPFQWFSWLENWYSFIRRGPTLSCWVSSKFNEGIRWKCYTNPCWGEFRSPSSSKDTNRFKNFENTIFQDNSSTRWVSTKLVVKLLYFENSEICVNSSSPAPLIEPTWSKIYTASVLHSTNHPITFQRN